MTFYVFWTPPDDYWVLELDIEGEAGSEGPFAGAIIIFVILYTCGQQALTKVANFGCQNFGIFRLPKQVKIEKFSTLGNTC